MSRLAAKTFPLSVYAADAARRLGSIVAAERLLHAAARSRREDV
jgi:hypothetical protein